MTDQPEQQQPEAQPQDQAEHGGPPAEANNTETQNTVPYERFAQVNERAKEALARLAQYEEDERKRKESEALQRGEHEQLLQEKQTQITSLTAQLEDLQAQISQRDDIIQGRVDALLTNIPERLHVLIKGESPLQKLAAINDLEAAGLLAEEKPKPQAPNIGAGVPTGASPNGSLVPDAETLRRRFNI